MAVARAGSVNRSVDYIVPDHICRYDKLTNLTAVGQGGFGQVYKARHADWGEVAYKSLPGIPVNIRKSDITLFEQEVTIHMKLRHPNIVTLMGLVYEPQHKGIIMHFQPYGDAKHFLAEFPVHWAWKLKMTYDIVLGMNYLHTQQQPLIHGDLKAKNVLIGHGYNAKIADFGLSFWKQLTVEVTRANPGGTVTHIPPESWENINGRRTEKYDIYGFAVLVWELLAYPKSPFHQVDTERIRREVLHGRRPLLADILQDVPHFMKLLVQKCWAQDPSLRPPFNEIKDELDDHLKTHKSDVKQAKIKLLEHERQRNPASSALTGGEMNVRTNPIAGVQDADTAVPLSVQDAGTAVPLSVQDSGTDGSLSIQDTGTAGPVTVQDAGTAVPLSVQDAGTAGPVTVQDAGTASPVAEQDAGTAGPVSVQDSGTASPVTVQDAGTAGPLSVQDSGTDGSLSMLDAGTAGPGSVRSDSVNHVTPVIPVTAVGSNSEHH
jgi:serine/threonine protein kinase